MYTIYTSKNQSITLLKGYGVSLIRKAVLVFALVGIVCSSYAGPVTRLNGTLKETKKITGPAEIRNNDRYTMEGSSVLYIEGDLSVLGELEIKDNAKLIVVGDLIQGKNGNVGCDINNTEGAYIVVTGTYRFNTNKSDDVASGWEKVANTVNVYINDIDEKTWPGGGTIPSYKDMDDFIEEHISIPIFLPIELTYFTAHESENAVVFDWQTASEINNDFFTVEYSLDGIQFNECAVENGNGTTSETHNYSVSVSSDSFYGVTYFRLKQTDFNGEYSYSNVILLDIDSNPSITLYPNPAVDRITINGEFEQAFFSNVYGRTVAVQQDSDKTFNVSTLPSGLYYVTVVTKRGKQVISFVKD